METLTPRDEMLPPGKNRGGKHTQTERPTSTKPQRGSVGTRNRKISQLPAGYEAGGVGGEDRDAGRGLTGAGCAKRPQWEM